jgi:hypothetical protein
LDFQNNGLYKVLHGISIPNKFLVLFKKLFQLLVAKESKLKNSVGSIFCLAQCLDLQNPDLMDPTPPEIDHCAVLMLN